MTATARNTATIRESTGSALKQAVLQQQAQNEINVHATVTTSAISAKHINTTTAFSQFGKF